MGGGEVSKERVGIGSDGRYPTGEVVAMCELYVRAYLSTSTKCSLQVDIE